MVSLILARPLPVHARCMEEIHEKSRKKYVCIYKSTYLQSYKVLGKPNNCVARYVLIVCIFTLFKRM